MSGSWGRLPIAPAQRIIEKDWRFHSLPELPQNDTFLAHGCRRSYGDSCINSEGSELGTRQLSRYIEFDTQTGVLNCEAGITLDEILQLIVPKGWFLPVVPGTRFVTLGGAIANDVHGKNHHCAGSFGCHVHSLSLLRSDGQRPHCSATEHPELFAATIGGLGLTGLITSAEIQLIAIASDTMVSENIPFASVAEFCQINRESADWPYTVSWIDTVARKGQVGRGVFTRARHADSSSSSSLTPGKSAQRLSVPFAPPISLVNRWTVDVFNRAYYTVESSKSGFRNVHYQPFFFPLDVIGNWNRVYGSKGFYQYQCVLPHAGSEQALNALLKEIHASGASSFLVVLKEFGDKPSPGMLSFPRPGLTLALDFPNRGAKTLKLLSSFDSTVRSVGGAIYPAKDARMPAQLFNDGYPRLQEFRKQIDPKFSSAFWRRVQL
ncbi:MAG: FAD/FMN-containing dehydrogenase [Halioglobus sp.]|jgi:FAD/FMN-containing dehydrogenase